MLRPRTVDEKFSTLLEPKKNSRGQLIYLWTKIPDLNKKVELMRESYPNAGKQFLASYWLQEARQAHLTQDQVSEAEKHLQAFLQEPCYWAAKEIPVRFPTQDMEFLDCLQIAQLEAMTPLKIFRRYDDSRGKSLESYGKDVLIRAIQNVVFKGNEAAKRSDWGLLHDLSKKALTGYLQKAGIEEEQLSRYLLAWQCFKEIYTPTKENRKLQPPTPEKLAAFAQRYNQERSQYQEPALRGSDIENLLQTCIWAARASTRTPQFISFEYLQHSDQAPEHSDQELPTPEEQAQPQEQWQQQVKAVLEAAIAELPDSGKTMLQLDHGLNLKQKDIGRAMLLQQYQVSRQLRRDKGPVLQALAKWSQTQTGIALSPEKINELSQPLNQWLDWYCQTPFHEFLQTTLLQELRYEIPLLQRYYGQELSQVEVASELNLDATDVNRKLEQVKQHLQSRLHNWVKDKLNLSPDALNSAAMPIAALVEEWLTNAKYSSLEI